MNNKNYIYIIGVLIIGIILSILYIFRYDKIDELMLNKKWYKYNYINGYYDFFNLSEDKMFYYRPSNDNSFNSYDACSKYRYNKKSRSIILDCKKNIFIKYVSTNKIVLLIDGEENVFFTSIDDSLNYEFNKFFDKSMSEYKNSEKQVLDLIKISSTDLINYAKEKNYSKFIFIGNKCTSVDCIVTYDVIEKWLSTSTSTYYINSDEINDKIINLLNKLDKTFSKDEKYYNDIYPRVIITYAGKIIDSYSIKCQGFDCSSYYNK